MENKKENMVLMNMMIGHTMKNIVTDHAHKIETKWHADKETIRSCSIYANWSWFG